jgi:hypothetical protein
VPHRAAAHGLHEHPAVALPAVRRRRHQPPPHATPRHATPRHHTPTRPLASSVTVTVTAAPPQKVKRLRASLHELDAPPKNTHTLFVDSDREAAAFERTLTLTLTLTLALTRRLPSRSLRTSHAT